MDRSSTDPLLLSDWQLERELIELEAHACPLAGLAPCDERRRAALQAEQRRRRAVVA